MDNLSFDNLVTTRKRENRDGPYIDPNGYCYGFRGDSILVDHVCYKRNEPATAPTVIDAYGDGDGYFVAFVRGTAIGDPAQKPSASADICNRDTKGH